MALPTHLFVTGASRSGTTMLGRLFGRHSAVRTFRELHFFGGLCQVADGEAERSPEEARDLAATIISRVRDDVWRARITDEDRALADRLLSEDDQAPTNFRVYSVVAAHMAGVEGKSIGCEQTPRNIFYAQALLDHFPDAHVVHIVRDPRAVLASQKNRSMMRANGADKVPRREMLRTRVNYHPFTMCKLWNQATTAAQRLRDHPRVHILRFEALVESPETEMASLCAALGLRYEPDMLNVPFWGSSNAAHSGASEARGVSKEAVSAWSEILTEAEVHTVERLSGEWMDRYGYARQPTAPPLAARLWSYLTFPFHAVGVVAVNPMRALTLIRGIFGSR